MEPWGTKSGPKVDKNWAKGEVWDHMSKMTQKKGVPRVILDFILELIFDVKIDSFLM